METFHMLLNIPKFEFRFFVFCLSQLLFIGINWLRIKTKTSLFCEIICKFYHMIFLLDPTAVQILEGKTEING